MYFEDVLPADPRPVFYYREFFALNYADWTIHMKGPGPIETCEFLLTHCGKDPFTTALRFKDLNYLEPAKGYHYTQGIDFVKFTYADGMRSFLRKKPGITISGGPEPIEKLEAWMMRRR